jgi:hypothetical protein
MVFEVVLSWCCNDICNIVDSICHGVVAICNGICDNCCHSVVMIFVMVFVLVLSWCCNDICNCCDGVVLGICNDVVVIGYLLRYLLNDIYMCYVVMVFVMMICGDVMVL